MQSHSFKAKPVNKRIFQSMGELGENTMCTLLYMCVWKMVCVLGSICHTFLISYNSVTIICHDSCSSLFFNLSFLSVLPITISPSGVPKVPARKVTDIAPFELKCMQRTRTLVMPTDSEIEAAFKFKARPMPSYQDTVRTALRSDVLTHIETCIRCYNQSSRRTQNIILTKHTNTSHKTIY